MSLPNNATIYNPQLIYEWQNAALKDNDVIHMYFWVSHGGNVSSQHNFYPNKIKFSSVVFYSKPYSEIMNDDLKEITQNPCQILFGSCPRIPITDNATNEKIVYLPPLIFSTSYDEDPELKDMIGLHYVKIKANSIKDSNNKISCNYVSTPEKVVNQQEILNLMITSSSSKLSPITYSTIFNLVEKNCKKKRIPIDDAIVGIFSCQSEISLYKPEYDQTTKSLIPRNISENIEPAKILNLGSIQKMENENTGKYFASLTYIEFKEKKIWNALAGVLRQGCGLNILSYYDILQQKEAREQTVCLSLEGTSIFKIVDYINKHIYNKTKIKESFFIIRFSLEYGIFMINNFINVKSSIIKNYAIIFKIYKEEKDKNEYIHRGHTISVCKTKDGSIYLIDPQLSIDILVNNNLIDIIKHNYPLFNFIDIIFNIRNNFNESRVKYKLTDFYEDKPLERTNKITYGGHSLSNPSLSRKSHKSKKGSRKSRKSNHHVGLDNYEKLVLHADENFKVKTSLIV